MSDWESLEDEEDRNRLSFYYEQHSSDSEESHASWYDEEDGSIKPGIRMPEKWRFLWKWFKILRGKVSLSEPWRHDTHDVRIGRDPDDWRIDVVYDEERLVEIPRETERKRFRAVREALILTSILAEVDYHVWLRELKKTSLFSSRKFMDLKTHKLLRQYTFTYFGNFPAKMYAWDYLQDVFGVKNYSVRFTTDFEKTVALAAEAGFDVYAMAPIPIEFRLRSREYNPTRIEQRETVRNIHASVNKIRDIETTHRIMQSTGRYEEPPVFGLEAIDLNYRGMEIRSGLLWELQRFVESGVHFKSLTLPMVVKGDASDDEDDEDEDGDDQDDDDEEDDEDGDLQDDALDVWVPFARSLTGQGTRPTRVSRLILPSWYCREPLLAAFCSALATARGLKFVRLEATKEYYDEDCVSWRSWAWLGYALFNPASTSSVEALSLAGFQLDDEVLTSLEDAKEAIDPLAHLWREITEPSEGCRCFGFSSRRSVTAQKHAKLFLYDTDHDDEYIYAETPMTGTAMDDGDIVDVMVPGYGFCQVDASSLQNKRQRRSGSSASGYLIQTNRQGPTLSTLLLDFNFRDGYEERTDACTFLPRLLEIVGASLTSLSINATDLDDDSLASSLEECPQLQNLSLSGMSLASMEPITDLHKHGIKLSSLELQDFKIPIGEFDGFLEQLANDQTGRIGLQRLRIGDQWTRSFRKSTAVAMQHALENNQRLEYVHLFKDDYPTDRSENGFRQWDCEQRFHRQQLFVPLASQSRLAFLSALRPSGSPSTESKPRTQLSQDVISTIFEFAAYTTRRVVIEQLESFLRMGRYE